MVWICRAMTNMVAQGQIQANAVLTDHGAVMAEMTDIKSNYGDLIGSPVHRIKVGSQKLGMKLGRYMYYKIR